MKRSRINVTGVPVDNVDMAGAVAFAEQAIDNGQQSTIFAMNPEKAMAARRQPELFECLSSSELLIADGIGIVIASRLMGTPFKERVPGSELMPALCEMAAKRGFSIYLFGAEEESNCLAAQELTQRYPSLKVAGRHNGYVTEANLDRLIDDINASGADMLFVALGSPRQEFWMQQNRHRLNVKVLQGVGGTFDVLAGRVKRAPKLWRAIHLEWLYRLLSQPQRFLRQTKLPAYVWLVMKQRVGLHQSH